MRNIFKFKKEFRVVQLPNGHLFRYRVDQRHNILFGLLWYYDTGASCLCPNYYFHSAKDVTRTLNRLYPGAKIHWESPHAKHTYPRR